MTGDSRIKALFLSAWYPHRNDPMFGLFVRNHAKAVADFCDIAVLYVHGEERKDKLYEFCESDTAGCREVIVYYKKSPLRLLNAIRYFRANIKGYKKIRSSYGIPDLVHVNILTRAALLALFLKFRSNIPYIITEHWSRYLPITGTYKGWFRKITTKYVVAKAEAVTCVTDNLKKAMISHGLKNNNYSVVPNVVNTDLFIPEELPRENDKTVITHVSCIDNTSKNIKGIINVMSELSKKRDDFVCRLVGDGVDKNVLEEYAEKLGVLGKSVFFDGLKEDEQLVDAFNKSDVILLFSNYENMPVVINESLACGLPVISSKVGGIAEILNEELGVMVEAGDEKALLYEIQAFLDKKRVYNKTSLRNFAVNNFSYAVVGKCFYDIYEKVRRNRGK